MNASMPAAAIGLSAGPARLLLAALLTATAVIHLALTPAHLEESLLMGLGFIAAGVLQLGFAVLVVLRPQPLLYAAVAVASIALVSLYCVNVAVGLPWAGHGPAHASVIESAAVPHDDRAATGVRHADAHDAQLGDSHEGEHAAAKEAGDHPDEAQALGAHGQGGIQIGSGEPVDAIGGANLAVELTSAGVAVALLRRQRLGHTTLGPE